MSGTMLARAVVCYVCALGLGASIAIAGDALAAIRVAGAIVTVVAAVGLARTTSRPSRLVSVATALVLGLLGAYSEPRADTALYIGCLVALLTAGPPLLAELGRSLALSGPGQGLLSIEAIGKGELMRARRAERPLTVGSVAVAGASTRSKLAEVARELRSPLRETDILGYGGSNRFLVLFVETREQEARAAWERLRGNLSEDVSKSLRVGFAAFPEDNPTWEGLITLAQERADIASSARVRTHPLRLAVTEQGAS